MNIVENARELAFKYHEGQMYGSLPYTAHLEDVVSSLAKKHDRFRERNAVLFATAFLHDVLEDTKCNYKEIIDLCGADVCIYVELLTKRKGQTYEQYILAVQSDEIALEVKLHDTLANLTASVMSGENGRIRKYSKQLQLLVGE